MKTINKNKVIKALGAFKSVENMSSISGNDVPNQFILNFENGEMFQSYDSIIAVRFGYVGSISKVYQGQTFLGVDWDYSRTTSWYRCRFMSGGVQYLRDALEHGNIKMMVEK